MDFLAGANTQRGGLLEELMQALLYLGALLGKYNKHKQGKNVG